MATPELQTLQQQQQRQELSAVLLFGHIPPIFSSLFPLDLVNKFHFLKPFESPSTPLHHFLTTQAQSVRALLCIGPIPVNAETLRCLPCLECVVAIGAGLDHFDLQECRRRRIAITNSSVAFSEDAADFAVGLLLDVLRRVSASDRYVRSGLWPLKGDYHLGLQLGGKRVGIVGLGSIGSEIAKRLKAFGCSISYNSRKKRSSVPYPYYSNAYDLASNSDILILSCALTAETHHIVDKGIMSALGKKGIIINVGRGALINGKELVHCLVNGEIGGAGLDVFENEPDVPKELFELDNVVLSPHKAILTPESLSAAFELAIANLEAFFSNKPLLSPVSFE